MITLCMAQDSSVATVGVGEAGVRRLRSRPSRSSHDRRHPNESDPRTPAPFDLEIGTFRRHRALCRGAAGVPGHGRKMNGRSGCISSDAGRGSMDRYGKAAESVRRTMGIRVAYRLDEK